LFFLVDEFLFLGPPVEVFLPSCLEHDNTSGPYKKPETLNNLEAARDITNTSRSVGSTRLGGCLVFGASLSMLVVVSK